MSPFDGRRAQAARDSGQEIVAVLGLGFVGTAVIANLARSMANGKPQFFVIGVDQDNPAGREKCARLEQGLPPVYASDHALESVISRASKEFRNVAGTTDAEALRNADVVIFCINLDLVREPGQTEKLQVNVEAYGSAMRLVGEKVRPGTLVTVESTLPIGTCDRVLYPALCEGQKKQGVAIDKHPPLLAYCYERVMPGPDYLDSVNNHWRSFAGINADSSRRARAFLSKFVNTKDYPLWEHKTTRAGEMSKLLENAYRATNIAFIEEWSQLAEAAGIDLFDVISSIRVRRGTHDNMMRPGLGVGGYCLTKDALLAAYGAERLLHVPAALPFSRRAILTNEKMPLRAVAWIREHFVNDLRGKRALLLGVTYRPGVADTRSSASEIVARAFLEGGAELLAYDPLLQSWDEMPQVKIVSEIAQVKGKFDAAVVCLPDPTYKAFLPGLLLESLGRDAIIVDPWNMIGDATTADLAGAGVTVRVYGRGDLPRAARSS